MNRKKLLGEKQFKKVSAPRPGKMYMYFYNPKHAKTLPYFDKFPLIIMVGPVKGGWYGLNLHYLPPEVRAALLDELVKIGGSKLTSDTKLRLTYNKLKGLQSVRAFQPCFKRYLANHVASKMVEIPGDEWENAVFLPTESFSKATSKEVWRDSLKQFKS